LWLSIGAAMKKNDQKDGNDFLHVWFFDQMYSADHPSRILKLRYVNS
jgi:hypothetical protein